MSSFTSVFKLDESRVVLVLLALLACLEVFFRTSGQKLSHDALYTENLKVTAQAMASAPPPRLLFVGNSLTRSGVDPELLAKEWHSAGGTPAPQVFLAMPDSSHALVWDYLVRRYFIEPGCLPEEVVIVTGRLHLLDSPANDSQMGAYYVSWKDMSDYLGQEVGSGDQASDFIMGRLFSTFSYRSRVSPRVFDVLLPDYQENWHILNKAAVAGSASPLANADAVSTTRHLRRLATDLKSRGVRLTIVAAPMPAPYKVNPQVTEALQELGVRLVDINPIAGIDASCFADEDHLNDRGKAIFTRALARALPESWRK